MWGDNGCARAALWYLPRRRARFESSKSDANLAVLIIYLLINTIIISPTPPKKHLATNLAEEFIW